MPYFSDKRCRYNGGVFCESLGERGFFESSTKWVINTSYTYMFQAMSSSSIHSNVWQDQYQALLYIRYNGSVGLSYLKKKSTKLIILCVRGSPWCGG